MGFVLKTVQIGLFKFRDFHKNLLLINNVRLLSSCSVESSTDSKQKKITVAVIGVPNAGKSTFINNLINHRVCPTSSKVHTTRKAHKAIYTTGDTQVILFDTPGLVTQKEIKKHHLESTFSRCYRDSIEHANIIAVMHDVSNSYTRNELHRTVLDTLEAYSKIPSFLVLNKIDALKSKRILLDLVKSLTNNTLSAKKITLKSKGEDKKPLTKPHGWSNFSDVFMVSSIIGDGLQEVMNYILRCSKPGIWEYPAETYTDDKPEDIIVNSVKARLLDYLPQEIPYNLKSVLEYYSVEKNIVYASVVITCPNSRIERLICGEGNGKLKQITERVTSDLVETFRLPISLTLVTSVKKSAAVRA